MYTVEAKQQFGDILEEIGKTLDITQEQHEAAVRSYEFVGEWLAKEDSPLRKYSPEILPQGSFMLGTMIRPENDDDELDIDLVCRFEGKNPQWTQFDLKQIVGDRLKSNGTIKKLLKIPDGKRCWTLEYSESAKFHMDVLPSIVSSGYKMVLEKAFGRADIEGIDSLAIRITDKTHPKYTTATNPKEWLKSNPFGYGIWFEQMASLTYRKSLLIEAAVQPVPRYQKEKLPLQRVVQILKRHRDMMFNGLDDKPISIIITTLAARAYRKEVNLTEALLNVVDRMPLEIEERYSPRHGRIIKWIANPVNPDENFADKWPDNASKEQNFYTWLGQVRTDIHAALQQKGMHKIQESLEKPFGKDTIRKSFTNYAESRLRLRETGALKMAPGTGTLGAVGTTVRNHTFHGKQ